MLHIREAALADTGHSVSEFETFMTGTWRDARRRARRPSSAAPLFSRFDTSADVILNILARQRDPAPPAPIQTPAALRLRHAPIADCARYDNLRSA